MKIHRLVALACLPLSFACSRATEDLGTTDAAIARDAELPGGEDARVPVDTEVDAGPPECVELCVNGDCRFDVHLPSVEVSGTISVAASPYPCEMGPTVFTFIDRRSGETFTHYVVTGPYSVSIHPGIYDVLADVQCTGFGARLVAADRAFTAPNNPLDVAFEVVPITGSALLGTERITGCPGLIPTSEFKVRFTETMLGEVFDVPVSALHSPEYQGWVYPGTYDVSMVLPLCREPDARFLSGEIPIAESRVISGPTRIDLLVDTVTISGDLPDEDTQRVRFVDRTTGRELIQQLPYFPTHFSFVLPRGTYDVYAGKYSTRTGDPGEFLVARNWQADMDRTLELNRDSGRARGSISVDGAPIASMCPGILLFENIETQKQTQFLVPQAELDVELAPGTYDAYFTPENYFFEDCVYPAGTIRGLFRVARNLVITAGGEAALDVNLTTVDLPITTGGPSCQRITFDTSEAIESLVYDGRMYPAGDYHAYVDLERCNLEPGGDPEVGVTPAYIEGRKTIVRGARVHDGSAFETRLDMVGMHGEVSFGGMPIPEHTGCDFKIDGPTRIAFDEGWRMTFTDRETGDRFTKRLAGGGAYALDMYPGTYDVTFALGQCLQRARTNDDFRLDGEHRVGCVILR